MIYLPMKKVNEMKRRMPIVKDVSPFFAVDFEVSPIFHS